ncbi:MAG: hypothetical protein L6Q99_18785 [Planctomycetes bacterium]|nr:hypothetical protein [Planctomycetota bacterium]
MLALAVPHELGARDIDPAEIWRAAAYRRAEHGESELFPARGIALTSWSSLGALRKDATSACGLAVRRAGTNVHAWVGTSHGIVCVDVTDPERATKLGSVALEPSTARALVANDAAVFATDSRGRITVLAPTPTADGDVRELAELDSGDATQPALALDDARGRLYVAAGRGGLATYDVSEPRAPKLVARWRERYVDSLVLSSDGSTRAACANGFNDGWTRAGVEWLDLADPRAPKTLGRVEWNGGTPHVLAWTREGERILALDEREATANGPSETELVRLSTAPRNGLARESSPLVRVGVAQHAAPFGARIAVAACRRGLLVFDASTGEALAHFDTVPKDDTPRLSGLWNVATLDEHVLVGVDLEKGLFVWRFSAVPEPAKSSGDGH